MKLWKKLVLVFAGVSIYTQVIADIPEELKQHIITHHDATAARSLQSAWQRAASSDTADAAQRAAKEVFSIDDEKAAAWLLSQPRLCGNAAIALKDTAPTPTHVRALCAAIRNAAPADGVGVFVEGDIDNPALIVATLKEVMDSVLQTSTPPIHRGDDGQYHKGDVDRWLVQAASHASNTTKINSELRAALKAYVAAANLH